MAAPAIIIDDVSKVFDSDTDKYLSLPYMTKYEFDQLIGLRATHLARGAPAFVDIPADYAIKSNMELRDIAVREMVTKRLPYIVKRTLPNGQHEYWPVNKLGLQMVAYLVKSNYVAAPDV